MITGKRVLVIVPAWNESSSLGNTLRDIHHAIPEADTLVVDDGSTDDTSRVALSEGVAVTRLPYNLGVGGAMRLGFRYAHEHGYDVAVQVDADGQHDPRFVPALIDALDGADLVVGARFDGSGDYVVRGPRRWAMHLLSFALSRLAKVRLTDTTSGFRACNRRLIEFFAGWYPVEYLGDTVESTVGALRCGFRVRQVPVAMRPRQAGHPSNPSFRAMIYFCRALFVLLLSLVRRTPARAPLPAPRPELAPAPSSAS